MNSALTFSALVAQTIVEQQLKDRSIPHTLQYPPPTGPAAARSPSAVAGMIPTICVNVHDLLKDRRASDTAQPKVYIQLKDWWKGEKCKVVTVVQLRHKPTLSSNTETSTSEEGALVGAARDEGISFDQASSVVRFEADDISRCVPSFLEQWERLSKVIVVAGEGGPSWLK
jgi:mediator of RNA polymerase II transcription subunit 14